MNQRARTFSAKLKKKELILNAAKELFFTKGYYGARIEAIVKKAGISTGTFYLYYKTKSEVFKALQNEGLDILMNMVQQVISWPDITALEKMEQIVHTYFRFHHEYPEYFDILAILSASPKDLKETQSEIHKLINTKTYRFLKMIEEVIIQGVKDGEVIKIDTWKTTNVFWGLMDGLILLEKRKNIENTIKISLDELIKQAISMSFYGITDASLR